MSGARHPVSSPGLAGRPSNLRSSDSRIESMPVRISLLDQTDLPCPRSLFEPLLASNRKFDISELFIIDQSVHVIFPRESRDHFRSVFVDASDEIAGYADIEGAADPARENVHPVTFLAAHSLSVATGSPGQAGR